jgi:hypothetical protein
MYKHWSSTKALVKCEKQRERTPVSSVPEQKAERVRGGVSAKSTARQSRT